MRGGSKIIAGALAVLVLAAPVARSAGPEDAKTAFEHRADTMKRMGRSLYTTIGKVVRGKAELDAQTIDAAQTIVTLAATIDGLFPPGSDVADSRVKPEIFAAGPRVTQLAAGVQNAAANLLGAVKNGDKTALATAYKVQDEACEACHRDFRKPE